MPNHCEPTKPFLDETEVNKLRKDYEKFINEIVHKNLTINFNQEEAIYLKVSRDNIEGILKDPNFCGLALAFGLKEQVDHSFKITTIVAPLKPAKGSVPSTSRINPGGPTGDSEIDWKSQFVFDDLGQGPSVEIFPYPGPESYNDEKTVNKVVKFIENSPSLQQLINVVLANPTKFQAYL